jgi:hypothetical protein
MVVTCGGSELTKNFGSYSLAVPEQTCFLCNCILQLKIIRLPVFNSPCLPLQNQIQALLRGVTLHPILLPAASLVAASVRSLLIPASRQLASRNLQPNG